MNTSAKTTHARATESFGSNIPVFSLPSKAGASYNEEQCGFSTIDGSVLAFNAGKNAINNGAGIFIGDYFVGLADSHFTDTAVPYIRY
ncbi:hypothetical protein ACFS7Z_24905 [Pontibacter toksunensis]|uniref:Uncharacterized protein n=1 Tax=Pontibacter toksunensis TaxID=1332631 RepID=A0ABW6C1H6_9BACT